MGRKNKAVSKAVLNRKEVERLWDLLKEDMPVKRYSLLWTTDCYCWRSKKRIDLDVKLLEESYERAAMVLLHEIAHILVNPMHLVGKRPYDEFMYAVGNQHTPEFWAVLELLAYRYLHCGLDRHQKKMMRAYCH